MIDKISPGAAAILPDQFDYLIATATRAPSVHNTQPWRFRVEQSAIELYSDPRRRLLLRRGIDIGMPAASDVTAGPAVPSGGSLVEIRRDPSDQLRCEVPCEGK